MFNEYMKYVLVFNTFLTLNDRKYISNLNFGRYLPFWITVMLKYVTMNTYSKYAFRNNSVKV